MNYIHAYATKNNYEYILHMEDDWHFVEKRNYVSESIKILEDDSKIGSP